MIFAIWAGKLATLLLRMRGKDATSFPGKVALRFSPRLLSWFGRRIERVIVVTGTNGKTTTTSLLAAMMSEEEPVITNHKGANLAQGIVTAFVQHATWRGKLRAKTAVLEIDEATFPTVARALPVALVMITNIFRDQLDRYGELDTTVEKLFEAVRKTDACLVLNGDDPISRHLGLRSSRKTFYYGMARDTIRADARKQMRDGQFCLQCGHELRYDGFWYGQLGLYSCPNCDFSRPHPEFIGTYLGPTMTLSESGLPDITLNMPVEGLYNAYNVLAASAGARVIGLWQEPIQRGLSNYVSPDGRMQRFDLDVPVKLNLIKNPTGCDSVVQAVTSDPAQKIIVIAINDLAADGKDVSWLWDADFEMFTEDTGVIRVITSGLRAYDMALRLKYAGLQSGVIDVMEDMGKALEQAVTMAVPLGVPVYVLTTYTLLHSTVHTLSTKVGTHDATNVAYRTSVS